jgi:hypothetical protein
MWAGVLVAAATVGGENAGVHLRYELAEGRQLTNSMDIKKPFRNPKRRRGNTQKK